MVSGEGEDMIAAKAYKKDRKRKYWITLIIGDHRYHIKTLEAWKLVNDLQPILATSRERINELKEEFKKKKGEKNA